MEKRVLGLHLQDKDFNKNHVREKTKGLRKILRLTVCILGGGDGGGYL